MLTPKDFFKLAENRFSDIFEGVDLVWEALSKIKKYASDKINPNVPKVSTLVDKTIVLYDGKVLEDGFEISSGDAVKGELKVTSRGEVLEGASVIYAGAALMDTEIEIGKGSVIEPGALIKGPVIIGDSTEVRQGAYLRGNVLVGDRCVVGHTTEMKSSVMLGGSKAGHFAYIGDSILGEVNLGAGTKLANLKVVDSQVVLRIKGKLYETGLRKFGAIMGDGVETGCNTVTSPGTVLSPGTVTYPNATVSGYYTTDMILKVRQDQETKRKK